MIRTILRFDVVSGRSYVCSVGSTELLSLMVILFCKVRHFMRVVSNSDDIDRWGGRNTHTRAQFQGNSGRGERRPYISRFLSSREAIFVRARVFHRNRQY